MTEAFSIFEGQADFDPAADFEAFLRSVPAKWVVYLLADAGGRPVQLLCVKNLRYSLKRRLGPEEAAAGPSRRVNYREIVRRVYWQRVDSAFEADWLYYEAARVVFPQTYAGMVGFRPAISKRFSRRSRRSGSSTSSPTSTTGRCNCCA